jgi:hypothetical protein
MRSVTWPGSDMSSNKRAVLLPGVGYTAQRPLLYWCAQLLLEQGWRVEAVEWTRAEVEASTGAELVEEAIELAWRGVPADAARLIVAKSHGTTALPWAVEHEVPGVWLTPVLADDNVRDALSRASAAHLAIGGDHDELWAPAATLDTVATMVTVPGADHGLLIEGDWKASVDAHSEVFLRIAAWVASLRET